MCRSLLHLIHGQIAHFELILRVSFVVFRLKVWRLLVGPFFFLFLEFVKLVHELNEIGANQVLLRYLRAHKFLRCGQLAFITWKLRKRSFTVDLVAIERFL